ncbi:MFS transporter [Citricoccus parietis]|uniref:MFS transporter n=2 Tax=Citricoccus TaxID=169133 RepID=A0ABV6F114_9MICC|nr:Predicted arabinose efflux permease, MFS family [Citricoccus sp. K5]
MELGSAIRTSKMGLYQWLVIAVCTLCNIMDGYDLFVMGFALPHLPEGFAAPAEKGYLVSSAFLGMALGMILIAPLADRYGRRPLALIGLTLNFVGMILAAFSPSFETLAASRFITGLGVGVMTTIIVVLATEYASAKKRNFAIGIIVLGLPLGSTIAGAVGLTVIDVYGGWQGLFVVGAVLSGAILLLTIVMLPESIEFLKTKDTEDSRKRVAAILDRIGGAVAEAARTDAPVTTPAAREVEPTTTASFSRLFSPRFRERTILLWLAFGGMVTTQYFITSWTPQLISNVTGRNDLGGIVGTVISFGGMLGALIFAVVGLRMLATKIAWIASLISAFCLIAFVLLISTPLALVAAAILGTFAMMAVAAGTSMAPPLYPLDLRARGYGSMIGFGRVGAILMPIIVGYALTVFTPLTLYVAAVVPIAIAAIVAFILWRRTRDELAAEGQQSDQKVLEAT